jgi:hypothetical protein
MLHLNAVNNMLNGCQDRFDRDQKPARTERSAGVADVAKGLEADQRQRRIKF